MKRTTIALLSTVALSLAACDGKSDTVDTGNNAAAIDAATAGNQAAVDASNAVTGGQTFADTAASSDMFEVETSKLAATNAKSPAIKSFATQMIKAHTKSTDKLKAVGASLTPPVTPAPSLALDQQEKLDDLKAKKGADFDKAYAEAQVEGHQAALTALRAYADTGEVPALKQFAADLVPTVTAHLNMAKGLKP